jgi:MFS transporter, DHA1 family, inner membrane transport protein
VRRSFVAPSLAIGLAYVVAFAVPPLIHSMARDLGTTEGRIGRLMTSYAVAYCVGGVLAGRLAGRFGARPLIAAGVIVSGLATVACATTDSQPLLIGLRFVVGLGVAAILTAGVLHIVETSPPASHGNGIGAITVAAYLGAVTANGLTPLIEGPLGWDGVLAVYGLVVTAGGVVFALRFRGAAPPVTAVEAGFGAALRLVASSRPLIIISVVAFLDLFALYGAHTWLPPFLEREGVAAGARSVAGIAAGVAAIPVAIIAGSLFARGRSPAILCTFSLAACVPVAAIGTLDVRVGTGVVAAALIWALAVAGANAATVPLFALGPSVVAPEAAALAAGIVTTAGLAGPAVAAEVGARLLDAGAGDTVVFGLFGAAALLGAMLAPALRHVRRVVPAG